MVRSVEIHSAPGNISEMRQEVPSNFFNSLKIISRVVVVSLACIAALYGLILLLRPEKVKILTLEEEFENLFKSIEKTQKLFIIEQTKVGIIFNPNGPALQSGGLTMNSPVLIVSERKLDQSINDLIKSKIPAQYGSNNLSTPRFNGQPIFKFLGLE